MSLEKRIFKVEVPGCGWITVISTEDVKDFVDEVLGEIDHLNEKFEAIAMRCNVESMAGDALCTTSEGGKK